MDVTTLKSDSILSMSKNEEPPLKPWEIEWCRRFARLRKSLGVTGEKFSVGIPGLHKSNVSAIEHQKRKPTTAMFKALAEKYPTHTSLEELIAADSTPAGMHAKSKMRLLPVLNEVQAGDYLMSGDLDYPPGFSNKVSASISKDPNAFFLIVRGESMIGGDIRPGDYVLIEPQWQVENGNIVVAIGPKGASIKKYRKSEDMIVLSPMNPDFPPLLVGKKEIEEYRFYRVVLLQRKI